MRAKIIAVSAVAGAVSVSQAGPVLCECEGVSRGRNVNISYGDAADPVFESRVFAGSILHQVDDAMLHTYCIDPEQNAQLGVTNFQHVRLERGLLKRDQAEARSRTLAELADLAGPSIWTSSASTLTAAAFQVAAWEIVSDYDASLGAGSFDFADGLFRSWGNDSVISAASSLLGQLAFNRADASGYDAYLHGTYQDFMSEAVPVPGVLAIAAVGVPLMAHRRRRALAS